MPQGFLMQQVTASVVRASGSPSTSAVNGSSSSAAPDITVAPCGVAFEVSISSLGAGARVAQRASYSRVAILARTGGVGGDYCY